MTKKELFDMLIDYSLDSDVEIILQHKKGDGNKGVQKITGNKYAVINAWATFSQTLIKNKITDKQTLLNILNDMED